VSGHLVAELSDGTRLESGPGSVFVIPAGHDAWVAGDEPCVIVQFDASESAARHFNVAGATAKAGRARHIAVASELAQEPLQQVGGPIQRGVAPVTAQAPAEPGRSHPGARTPQPSNCGSSVAEYPAKPSVSMVRAPSAR